MSKHQMIHKVTLSSNKVVLLKEMKLEYEEMASQVASGKSGDNVNMMAYYMQTELLKLLIAGYSKTKEGEPKPISATEMEDINSLFSYQDISQLRRVVQKLLGEDLAKEPEIEIISSGVQ